MSERIIPRLRGRVYQVGKQYTWEAWITIGEDEPPNGVHLQSQDKFMNFTAAKNDMQAKGPEILKQACLAMGGTMPEEFIDLKGGRIVSEEEFKKPKTFGKG